MNTEGNVYYVAPAANGGDNQHPGTLEAPWETIQFAAGDDPQCPVKAGDTIFVRGGTYNERITHFRSGEPGAPIRFAAYPGERVIIDGQQPNPIDVPADSGLWDFNRRSCISVSGFELTGSAYAGFYAEHSSEISIERNIIQKSASSGIGIWGCDHVIVDGNELALNCSNGMQECITLSNTTFFEAKNNLIYNSKQRIMRNGEEVYRYGKEGICVKESSQNGKVYKNTVHDVCAVGIYIDAELESEELTNVEVYQNEVYDSEADGIALAHEAGGLLETVLVYDNLCYRNGYVGIDVKDNYSEVYLAEENRNPQPIRDVQIINNTVIGNGVQRADLKALWGGGIGVLTAAAVNITIRNNLVSANHSFQLAADTEAAAQVTIDHDLVCGFRPQEELDLQYDSSCVVVADDDQPLIAAGPRYHLTALSSAIDKGSGQDAPAFDFDGNQRPQGASCDIGAFEYCPPGN